MEYMLNHAVLATLVELSIGDTPFGVKGTSGPSTFLTFISLTMNRRTNQACVVELTSHLIKAIPDHLLRQPSIIRPICRLLKTSSHPSGEGFEADVFGAPEKEEPRAVTSEMRVAREENRRVLEATVIELWAQLWMRIERT